MHSSRKVLFVAAAAVVLNACAAGEQFRHSRAVTPPPPSPRDTYAGTVSTDADAATVRAWEDASRRALRSGLSIPASFQERVRFPAGEPHAVAYRFTLREGQRLHIRHRPLEGEAPLFTEVFQDLGGEIFRPADAAPRGGRELTFTARATGEYVLRLQPQIGASGLYEISVDGDAGLLFPVLQAGLHDIGSVFGDPRDGGRRRHEGVDIFAPRGTPVVAVASGHVTRVSTDNVGGRVVWLTCAASGLSYYYAHLDSHSVRQGEWVEAGQVLGTVGNTGNARGTSPHLHFGVYAPGRVALDPAPMLVAGDLAGAAHPVDANLLGRWARTTGDRVRLRTSPSLAGAILAELHAETPLLVVGGVADWHRVVLPDGMTGFVSSQFTAMDAAGSLR